MRCCARHPAPPPANVIRSPATDGSLAPNARHRSRPPGKTRGDRAGVRTAESAYGEMTLRASNSLPRDVARSAQRASTSRSSPARREPEIDRRVAGRGLRLRPGGADSVAAPEGFSRWHRQHPRRSAPARLPREGAGAPTRSSAPSAPRRRDTSSSREAGDAEAVVRAEAGVIASSWRGMVDAGAPPQRRQSRAFRFEHVDYR